MYTGRKRGPYVFDNSGIAVYYFRNPERKIELIKRLF